MQRPGPERFPGNPAMVDELYARVVSGVDKLELQLRHVPDAVKPAEVRSDNPSADASGYQAAVASIFGGSAESVRLESWRVPSLIAW